MNKSEFKAVLDVLGIKNQIAKNAGAARRHKGAGEEVYGWKGLSISFGGQYAIVDGEVPYEVAREIYDMFPHEYNVRVSGDTANPDPKEYAKSQELDNYVSTLFKRKDKDLPEKYESKKNELLGNNPDSFYIYSYHIDTKEGLAVLLSQVKDCFESQQIQTPDKKSTQKESRKIAALLGEVERHISKQTNHDASTREL